MLSIANAVSEILHEDALALEMLQRDLLNASAYAKEIRPEVEDRTKKPVRLGSVIVALSRLGSQIKKEKAMNPMVTIDNFSVTSGLAEITYDKTDSALNEASSINPGFIDNANAFFTITIGVHEITIICSENIRDKISSGISVRPKVTLSDLVAVSVRFSDDYMEVPNTIYSLVGALAVRQINVMEIISTYTELTFVIYAHDLEQTIRALNTYQLSQKRLGSGA